MTTTPSHPYCISRLTLVSSSALATHVDLDGSLTDPLFGNGSLWLVRGSSSRPEDFRHSLDLIRADPLRLRVTGSVRGGRTYAVLATHHAIWVATTNASLLRVDQATMNVTVARKFFTWHRPPASWPLFDACGPERLADLGNPVSHPRRSSRRRCAIRRVTSHFEVITQPLVRSTADLCTPSVSTTRREVD